MAPATPPVAPTADSLPITVTLYPSLFAPRDYTVLETTWGDFTRRLQDHPTYPEKHAAPGFGPYRLGPPKTPCRTHGPTPVADPHRCDRCVADLTLAVFDVDVGTRAAVVECDRRLAAGAGGTGYARAWYTSWSYDPDADVPSLRLVVPFATPVPAHAHDAVRAAMLRDFAIPADPVKCSGLSHFYFAPARPDAPACPAGPADLGGRFTDVVDGVPYDASAIVARTPRGLDHGDVDDYFRELTDADRAPPDPAVVAQARAALEAVAARYSRSRDLKTKEKGRWLALIAAGRPLAQHGSRRDTTFRAAGVLAHAGLDVGLAVLWALLEPSIEAMRSEGSTIDPVDLRDRALAGALQHARAKAERDRQIVANLGKWTDAGRVKATRR